MQHFLHNRVASAALRDDSPRVGVLFVRPSASAFAGILTYPLPSSSGIVNLKNRLAQESLRNIRDHLIPSAQRSLVGTFLLQSAENANWKTAA